ncbi:hypothetical protein EVAR_87019_1 [Eumeta japonica]|uniref:Uncharacterized protein n=1 Tax=Eumeta variegata TaxID=151549 RepID=A0A4C1W9F6_EUMVA|nr:hypothetical protein EVAR_87019_1 [Eumeta japonica]
MFRSFEQKLFHPRVPRGAVGGRKMSARLSVCTVEIISHFRLPAHGRRSRELAQPRTGERPCTYDTAPSCGCFGPWSVPPTVPCLAALFRLLHHLNLTLRRLADDGAVVQRITFESEGRIAKGWNTARARAGDEVVFISSFYQLTIETCTAQVFVATFDLDKFHVPEGTADDPTAIKLRSLRPTEQCVLRSKERVVFIGLSVFDQDSTPYLLVLLDMHLEQCSSTQNSVFSGLSSDIQNDLIKSIAQVIRDEIKSEINFTKFVSLIADETPDISHREQMSVIFRYLTKTGIEERFVDFFDVSLERGADQLSQSILEVIDQFNCKEKLVGYSGPRPRPGVEAYGGRPSRRLTFCCDVHMTSK